MLGTDFDSTFLTYQTILYYIIIIIFEVNIKTIFESNVRKTCKKQSEKSLGETGCMCKKLKKITNMLLALNV